MNNNPSNFALANRPSEAYASFRGPMLRYPIVKSIDRQNGVVRRWIVLSSGRRSRLAQFLFGKWLWDELNRFENLVFWSLSEITSEQTIYLSLKAFAFGIPKKLLRKRLEKARILFGINSISRQQYLSLKGQLNCIFIEETITLRPTIKYSGYTKHYKDKGTLGTEREYYLSEILSPCTIEDEIIFQYLTVGDIPLFGGVVLLPEDDPKRSKRKQKIRTKPTKE